jgi:hypothetical protein
LAVTQTLRAILQPQRDAARRFSNQRHDLPAT